MLASDAVGPILEFGDVGLSAQMTIAGLVGQRLPYERQQLASDSDDGDVYAAAVSNAIKDALPISAPANRRLGGLDPDSLA